MHSEGCLQVPMLSARHVVVESFGRATCPLKAVCKVLDRSIDAVDRPFEVGAH